MKRTLAMLLALCLLLALAACGNNATAQTNDPAPANTPSPSASSAGANSGGSAAAPQLEVEEDSGITSEIVPWFRGDYTVYTSKGAGITKKTPADTIVYGSSSQTTGADPNGVQEEYCFSHQVYDCLIARDLTGQTDFVPALATEWGYDDEGNFNITLREGVKFHDGTTLDADDVLYTFQRIAGSRTNKSSTTMRSVDFEKSFKTDDLHLTLVFKDPVGNLLSDLASGFCGIVSKEFFEENPDDPLLERDAGSGPYQLVETVSSISQTFERFDDYWGGAPEVKTVIYRMYKDYAVMAIDFMNGDLDVCFNNTFDTVTRFLEQEITDAKLYQVRSRSLVMTLTTRGEVPFSDERLRQAMVHCIDYEQLIQGAYQDLVMASVTTSPFTPGTKYEIDMGPITYDPEMAASLVQECGYSVSNPVKLRMLSTNTPQNAAAAQIIQAFGAAVGFEIEIDTVDTTTSSAIAAESDVPSQYDLFIISGSYNTGSPEAFMQKHEMYSSPETASAITAIEDPELNELAERAAHSVDEAERAALYAQIQELFYEHAWEVNLFTINSMILAWDYVGDLQFVSGQHPSFASFSILD